eukprot:scaffold122430_cov20-Cyclotella_meneghiniana.AAC.1
MHSKTHQPWNPLHIHRVVPQHPLIQAPPVAVTVIARVGDVFVVNRGLVASAVMFFVTTAQNYLSTWGLKTGE